MTKYYLWTLLTSKDPVLSGGFSAFPGLQQITSCIVESKSYHLFETQFCLLPNRVLTPPIQGMLWRTNVKALNILSNKANVKDYYCQYYDCGFQHFYHGKHLEIRKALTGIMPLISETKTTYLTNLKYLINSRLRKMMLPSQHARDPMSSSFHPQQYKVVMLSSNRGFVVQPNHVRYLWEVPVSQWGPYFPAHPFPFLNQSLIAGF